MIITHSRAPCFLIDRFNACIIYYGRIRLIRADRLYLYFRFKIPIIYARLNIRTRLWIGKETEDSRVQNLEGNQQGAAIRNR